MSVDADTLIAIAAMALITAATRLGGLLIARRYRPSGRAQAAFDAIPPAVLTAVIAPMALATGRAETLAAAVTILAALRLPTLVTVAVGVVAVVVLRHLL